MRDFSTQEQLLVLSNLEVLNSQFVKEGLPKEKRLKQLNEAAILQMTSLLRNEQVKKLNTK